MKMTYTGYSESVANWGQGSDPRPYFEEGKTYEVSEIEVHSWHTCLHFKGIKGKYNSGLFDPVNDEEYQKAFNKAVEKWREDREFN